MVPANDDELIGVDWNQALDAAADALRDRTVGIIGGARLANEDAYAWSKLARTVIGTNNIDAQLADGLDPAMVQSLPRATIDEACRADTVIVIGPDLKDELPVLFLRLRGAAEKRQTRIVEFTHAPTGLTPYAKASHTATPGSLAHSVDDALNADSSIATGSVVVVVGRGNLATSPTEVAEAVGVIQAAIPAATFLPALRRGNVMGALDMGLTPSLLPGRVGLEHGAEWFRSMWGSVASEPGLDTAEMLEHAASGRLDTLVLLGSDPLADVPDRDLVERAFAGVGSIIAIDIFANASTRRAAVVLPVAGYAEKGGTTTNLEGRVTRLGQMVTPPGTARADWMIAAELAWRLGGDLELDSPAAILNEISTVVPSHLGIADIEIGAEGVLLPLPAPVVEETPSTDGPVLPAAIHWQAPPLSEARSSNSYALRLVARRKLYDNGTGTAMSPSISHLADGATISLHPSDSDRLGLTAGDHVNVTSSRTTVAIPVNPDSAVPRGVAVMGVNQPGCGAGELIDLRADFTEIQVETR